MPSTAILSNLQCQHSSMLMSNVTWPDPRWIAQACKPGTGEGGLDVALEPARLQKGQSWSEQLSRTLSQNKVESRLGEISGGDLT